MNILIVGAGNIGKRHLESLSKSHKIKNFYIIDKNIFILKNLKKKFKQKKFFFFRNLGNLKKKTKFDLVIISTNSDNRFEIFKSIIKHFKVENFILEKFVFQNISHYNLANKLIEDHNLKVFINCPMRTWAIFKKIKFRDYKSRIKIILKGSKWGLASNAIHYIDLLIFFSNKNKITISKNHELEIHKSKRKNFIEFDGKLDVRTDKKHILQMIDNFKKNYKPQLYIELNDIIYEFDAGRNYYYVKKYRIYNKNKKKLISNYKFKTPLQSQLTLKIFKDIQTKNQSSIPSYNDLFQANKSVIKLFTAVYREKINSKKKVLNCPVT